MSTKISTIVRLWLFFQVSFAASALAYPDAPTGEPKTYIITAFGAVGDGVTVNTGPIQAAINACFAAGGGIIVVPAGNFLTGTIELKSNSQLQLDMGAKLIAPTTQEGYDQIDFVHNEMGRPYSWIWAKNAHNISITGEGELELRGSSFVDGKKIRVFGMKEIDMDEVQKLQAPVEMGWRPNQPIFFHNCQDIAIRDIKITDSPCWTLVFSVSKHIKLSGLSIDSNTRIPNNDGIHLCSCSDVIITNCRIVCGDDCIALTGITDWREVSTNIVISNCIMRSSSSAIRIGFLASKVDGVLINNIIVTESNRGMYIAAGKGGYVKNVLISNVRLQTAIKAGGWWGKGEPFVISADDANQGLTHIRQYANEAPALIENICFSSIQAIMENSLLLVGNGKNVRNITFNNCHFTLIDSYDRALIGHVYDLEPSKVRNRKPGTLAWVHAEGVQQLTFTQIQVKNALVTQKNLNIMPILVNDAQLSIHVGYDK